MKIRFLSDADLNPKIGRGLCRFENKIYWRHAQGLVPDGTPDGQVLRLAADEGRVLVSRDRRTMSTHFWTFVRENESPGLILVQDGVPIGEAIKRLRMVWTIWSAEEMVNQVRWLPR